MGDAGRQLADRRHPILQTHLLLQDPPLGQVLEDQDVAAGRPLGAGQGGEGVANEAALPLALVLAFAARPLGGLAYRELAPVVEVEKAEVVDRPAEELLLGQRQDLLGGLVDAGHQALQVGRDEPARDRLDDVAVHDLEIRQVLALAAEGGLGLHHVLGQMRAQ